MKHFQSLECSGSVINPIIYAKVGIAQIRARAKANSGKHRFDSEQEHIFKFCCKINFVFQAPPEKFEFYTVERVGFKFSKKKHN